MLLIIIIISPQNILDTFKYLIIIFEIQISLVLLFIYFPQSKILHKKSD